MKKVIFILGCIFLINSINCFSQSVEKCEKEFKSKKRHVLGHSVEFNILFTMVITFNKIINSSDTIFFIEFHLSTSSMTPEYWTDICINRANSIIFLAKNDTSIDLKLTDVRSFIKSDKEVYNPLTPFKMDYHSTILKTEVTKEELILIASNPFYKLQLPYFNCSSKIYHKLEFTSPKLFTGRKFIQKNINYILNI